MGFLVCLPGFENDKFAENVVEDHHHHLHHKLGKVGAGEGKTEWGEGDFQKAAQVDHDPKPDFLHHQGKDPCPQEGGKLPTEHRPGEAFGIEDPELIHEEGESHRHTPGDDIGKKIGPVSEGQPAQLEYHQVDQGGQDPENKI